MIATSSTVYMIRRRADGLFSRGGMGPRFSKTGKAWHGIGQLKCHLRMFMTSKWDHSNGEKRDWHAKAVYSGCDVIAVACLTDGLIPPLPDPIPVMDLVAEMRKADKK